MNRAFEVKPLLVAAGIGAVIALTVNHGRYPATAVGIGGAIFGTLVQLGVRLVGVS